MKDYMKKSNNIYLLPTDQPTGIFETNSGLQFSIMNKVRHGEFKGFHIYITSSEEIKDVRPHKGKWQLEQGQILNKFPDYLTDLSDCKLVVMTTDPTLIADGVQEIDNEFLEWFIKNPTCKFIKVTKLDYLTNRQYRIYNLPQEEPKQEILPEFTLSKSVFDKISELSSTELSPEFQQLINDNCDYLIGANDKIKDPRCRCIRPSDGTCEYCESKESKRILDEAKEQKPKDYSEEEVRELIISALTHNDDKLCGSLVTVEKEIRTTNFNVWFEQNKKK
jgi:hypothetical protein